MNAREYREKGIMEFDNGNIEEALSLFEKAVELRPKAILALHYRGMCKCLLAENQEQLDDAISDLKQTVGLIQVLSQMASDQLKLL